MKHLFTKQQIVNINANTQFKVFPNFKFGLYELHYKKRLFRNMVIYLHIDSMFDDRPLYRQVTDYVNLTDPELEAAKRYLATQEYPLQDVLNFYKEYKRDLKVLEKIVNNR